MRKLKVDGRLEAGRKKHEGLAPAKWTSESHQEAFLLFHNLTGKLRRVEERTYDRDIGLSSQQFFILVTVASADPPVTQTAIADRLRRTQSAISMMVDRMEKLGLVTRVRSTLDRRETHVSITDEGRIRLEEALAVGRVLTDRLYSIFTESEIQEATGLMTKLRDWLMAELGVEPTNPAVERNKRLRMVRVLERGARIWKR